MRTYKNGEYTYVRIRRDKDQFRCFIFSKYNLGQEYYVFNKHCKLIKTTPKGYNFLNIKTNKCIFPRQFYSIPNKNDVEGLYFFIPVQIHRYIHNQPKKV